MVANIFDIKRFGTNDGEGLRTVIFIKGCPLCCRWCHNPEGLSREIGVWRTGNCMGCLICTKTCKNGAITCLNGEISVLHSACTACGACVKECPTGALQFDAKAMSVDEVLLEIERDRVFYADGGGVTLSGGEPTLNSAFSLALLSGCKERAINTAIETCLHTDKDTLQQFMAVTDSFIADIKLIDPTRHKRDTGVDNGMILENITFLAKSGVDLLIRIPLIPNHTADEQNLRGIADFLRPLGTKVQLINYNPLCVSKYRSLQKQYIQYAANSPYTKDEMMGFALYFEGMDVIF